MTQTFTLLKFVAHLGVLEHQMHEVNHAIVARACQMVAEEAKRVIGTYDYGWPQLKPETLARKFYDTPLLETGEMRDSIEWHTEGLRGFVGSNNDKAAFHEFGTSRIPPRPFLGPAAAEMGAQIEKMAGKAVFAVVMGKGLHSSEMLELLHLLKHIGHHVKEGVARALETPEERERKRR
jgi:HK97 gp10 family phage protein